MTISSLSQGGITTNKKIVKVNTGVIVHRLMTKCLTSEQSYEMLDWLDDHRDLVISIEHTDYDSYGELILLAKQESVTGFFEGPWLIVLEDAPEDVVFFLLKWC